MKVSVIGYGNVGMSVFRELQEVEKLTELTLVGRNMDKMKGEVRDYRDARVLRSKFGPELSYGGYEKTADADIIIYAAGVYKVDVADRNSLLHANMEITRDIFSKVDRYNRNAIVICLTNPLDTITTAVCKITGRPASKVIGTGNMLETARLIAGISELLEISPRSVDALCIGEHGNSAVVVSHYSRIYGRSIAEYIRENISEELVPDTESIERAVKKVAFNIYNAKGSTAYGAATCAAKLVQVIADDSREILPVSTVLSGEYGVSGHAISVPCMIGREGRIAVHQIKMNESEKERFNFSASVIRENCRIAGLI